jgi:hypothetical protein
VGVYGDQLAAFTELMEDHTVFNMDAAIGGGYGERYNIRKVTGYWSWRKSGKEGIEGEARVPNHQATFWARDDYLTGKPLVGQTDYVENGGDVFQVVEDDGFSKEGGFTKCLMQRVAANTDKQAADDTVNLGAEDFN